jgi:hypothetical protein
MSRRLHISEAEREIGVHERDEIEARGADMTVREPRPKRPAPPPAPKTWSLFAFLSKGYHFCRACKVPTSIAPDTTNTCTKCGSDRVVFVPPEPAFVPKR